MFSVASVRCFHSIFWMNWPMTVLDCTCVNHDHSSPEIGKGQGQGNAVGLNRGQFSSLVIKRRRRVLCRRISATLWPTSWAPRSWRRGRVNFAERRCAVWPARETCWCRAPRQAATPRDRAVSPPRGEPPQWSARWSASRWYATGAEASMSAVPGPVHTQNSCLVSEYAPLQWALDWRL